ncbi:MAG: DUF6580 family putative transport protein [Planctomycetota bacterium]|nr:DUF6580 family putative transport protein [Planctomycetota bacterium]
MNQRPALVCAGIFVLLVAVAAGSRLVDAAPNFAAVGAAALFAGFLFRSRVAACAVPVAAMLVSDALIGFYNPALMAAVYGSFIASAFLGRLIQRRPGVPAVAAGALASASLFFVVTNFAVWLTGSYGLTVDGLVRCFVAALPFFKYTLAGDVCYAAAFFGAAALARSLRGAASPAAIALR